MSIAKQIERLQSAKDALKDSIERKGVTVPSTALLEDYSSLVSSISTSDGSSFVDFTSLINRYTYNLEVTDYGSDVIIFYYNSSIGRDTITLNIMYGGNIVKTITFISASQLLGVIVDSGHNTKTIYYSNSLNSETFDPSAY